MLNMVDRLIKKFRININQIINNSDNEYEDVKNEAYIVLNDNYDRIVKDEKVFINELRNSCLKFNKYNTRITEKERWERYNILEERLVHNYKNELEINEDVIVGIESIKKYITQYEYDFLIYYVVHGGRITSDKYNISESTVRKRFELIKKRIRKEMEVI